MSFPTKRRGPHIPYKVRGKPKGACPPDRPQQLFYTNCWPQPPLQSKPRRIESEYRLWLSENGNGRGPTIKEQRQSWKLNVRRFSRHFHAAFSHSGLVSHAISLVIPCQIDNPLTSLTDRTISKIDRRQINILDYCNTLNSACRIDGECVIELLSELY